MEEDFEYNYGTPQSTIDLLKSNGFSDEVINEVCLKLHHVYYKKPSKVEIVDTDKQRKLNILRAKFFKTYGCNDIYKLVLSDLPKYQELSSKWKKFKQTLPDVLPEELGG